MAGGICASGAAAQLYLMTTQDEALASGAIVPLASIWFVVSNWLCANATFLYARHHLPLWWIVLGWFGLAGGGTDHLIELYTYFKGNHQPFAEHWVDMTIFGLPMVWFPFVAFGVTSIMGIWGMIYVFLRHDTNASTTAKVVFGLWALAGGLFGLVFEPAVCSALNGLLVLNAYVCNARVPIDVASLCRLALCLPYQRLLDRPAGFARRWPVACGRACGELVETLSCNALALGSPMRSILGSQEP